MLYWLVGKMVPMGKDETLRQNVVNVNKYIHVFR